ncbi:MAG: hypothetical protein RIQ33_254 [Bacteroidota bacterium]|jgi:HTH-type transcriptional regulator/antitoxin HigA
MIPLDPERIPSHATHPGELIKDELHARKITQNEFSKQTKISTTITNEIIKGKRRVNIETAIKLEKFFGISAETWLNLQRRYDKVTNYHRIEAELKKLKLSPKKRKSLLNAAA